MANSGLVTILLGGLGLAAMWGCGKKRSALVWLTVTGYVLSLGLFLKWDGEVMRVPFLRPLTELLWRLGHTLKPRVFLTSEPDAALATGLPLPGLVLTAVVPFFESARTLSRYMLVGYLGVVTLAARGVQRLPRWARYAAIALWLVELLPVAVRGRPIPQDLHPAYEWLVQQQLPPGEGIVDMSYPTLELRGEVLYAASKHGVPTASGYGSTWPERTSFLISHFWRDREALSKRESAFVLRAFRVRYVFLHRRTREVDVAWDMILANPELEAVRCFDPSSDGSPWRYPICVARVRDADPRTNVVRTEGWSGAEDWGTWAEGIESEARWIATLQQEHELSIEAFPFCVPDREQEVAVEVNGQHLATHRWEQCDAWNGSVSIPARLVQVGWNSIAFRYAYAVRPTDLVDDESSDPRSLSVGWARLYVQPYPDEGSP